jgi:hypothetical protein
MMNGIIVQCPHNNNLYAANNTLPAKKDADNNWTDRRFCTDLRQINAATIADPLQMPLVQDLFELTRDSTIFTKLDLRAGYHQIPVAEDSQPKLAFWWGRELFMYKRMPMGARNSSATFQRIMDFELTKAGLSHCAMAYQDDILIHSRCPKEHNIAVRKVLQMLHKCGLRAHPDKTIVAANVVEYLGHNISRYGLSPSEAKVLAIRKMKSPTNLTELRTVLGFLNYYRAYVVNYSALAKPLTDLTRKDAPFDWTPQCEEALQALKDELCTEGKALRRVDPTKEITVYTDWCNKGIGAVLSQTDDSGQDCLCVAISRSLNTHERKYEPYKGEMLAVVWAVRTLRVYLHGRSFKLVTDHKPLLRLMKNQELTGQYARWALILQEYDFEILHRAGVSHQNADALSRMPMDWDGDTSGARLNEEGEPTPTIQRFMHSTEAEGHAGPPPSGSPAARALRDTTPQGPQQAVKKREAEQQALEEKEADSARVAAVLYLLGRPTTEAGLLTDLEELDSGWVLDEDTPDDDTGPLHPTTVQRMADEGVTLFEPFGGLCAGLEMCLTKGVKVHKYWYCDIAGDCRAIAQARLGRLSQRHLTLLAHEAWQDAMTIPQDIYGLDKHQLVGMVEKSTDDWLIVAGWQCQDHSSAGRGAGLGGPRGDTYYELVRVVRYLRHALGNDHVAYILENTA